MRLRELTVSTVILEGGPTLSKDGLIASLLMQLAEHGHAPTASLSSIYDAILRRERLGSTGIGRDVAIPHAVHAAVTKLLAILAMCRTAGDFQSLDRELVDIVAVLVITIGTSFLYRGIELVCPGAGEERAAHGAFALS